MVWGTFGLGWGGRANRGGRGGGYKRVGGYPLHNTLLPPCSKSELTQSDLNTVLLRWPGVTQWPLGLLRSRFIGLGGAATWSTQEMESKTGFWRKWHYLYTMSKHPYEASLRRYLKITCFTLDWKHLLVYCIWHSFQGSNSKTEKNCTYLFC